MGGLIVTIEPGHSLDVTDNDTSRIPSAVANANAADIAIVFLGLCSDHCPKKVSFHSPDSTLIVI